MGFLHGRKPGLLAQFALMSLLPIVALGFVLARDLRRDARRDALREARRVTQTAGNLALGQILEPSDVRNGIDPRKIAPLDRALHRDLSGVQVVRIKVWSPKGEVVYSDDKGLIGHRFPLSEELSEALEGHVASEVSDLQLGRAAPGPPLRQAAGGLRAAAPGRRGAAQQGAFELYTPYAPVAARASAEGRHVGLLLLGGLGALWLCLFRIAAGASRRLRRQAAENERLALHDPVTDLPNRTLFRDRVRQALLAAERDRGVAAVLLMDIDRFKDVNDTLGHPNGDRLLRDIGVRLGAALRASDTIARLGGDEFAVLLPRIGGAAGAVEVSEKLLAALEAPFTIRDLSIHVEASLGIALFPEHGTDTDALIQHADIAMYAAKRSRTRLELYSPETGDDDPRQLVLLGELRRALESDELVLHYQPKIDLRTGGVAGVEALVRWCHPTRGMLAPADFVPLAERTGLVRRLSARVLHLALADARVWRDQGLDLEIAVNLSVANLIDPRLLDDVAGALAESPGPPGPPEAGDHRERVHGRPDPRARGAAPPLRHGRAPLDRRLRHRPLLARLPPAPSGGRAEDRSVLRDRHGRGQGQGRHRALHHRAGQQPRAAGGRRGRGDGRGPGPSGRAGLSSRPGLPLRAPDAVRAGAGVGSRARPAVRAGRLIRTPAG